MIRTLRFFFWFLKQRFHVSKKNMDFSAFSLDVKSFEAKG